MALPVAPRPIRGIRCRKTLPVNLAGRRSGPDCQKDLLVNLAVGDMPGLCIPPGALLAFLRGYAWARCLRVAFTGATQVHMACFLAFRPRSSTNKLLARGAPVAVIADGSDSRPCNTARPGIGTNGNACSIAGSYSCSPGSARPEIGTGEHGFATMTNNSSAYSGLYNESSTFPDVRCRLYAGIIEHTENMQVESLAERVLMHCLLFIVWNS